MQALPGHMVELFEEPVEEGALYDLAQAEQDRGAAGNPEHIEAAQRVEVDGRTAFGQACGRRRLDFT